MAQRKSLNKQTQLTVWYRDRWHCSYCGQPIFFSPALKLLDALSPGRGYYHGNGKRGEMLALLENRCASCDHVTPVSKGGDDSLDNLVAACFECNRAKSDSHPGSPTPAPIAFARPPRWDGFASLYANLPGADAQWVRWIRDLSS